MTGTSASTEETTPQTPDDEQYSLRGLWARHRRLSIAAIGLLVVLVAIVTLGVIGAGEWKVSDSTSCTAWSSANQSQQSDYASLYVREHGPLSKAAGVVAAINDGCTLAFSYDENDTISVLQAIRHEY